MLTAFTILLLNLDIKEKDNTFSFKLIPFLDKSRCSYLMVTDGCCKVMVSELESVLAKDKQTFPDNADIWLKDLASLINLQLSNNVPVSDLTFEGKSPGM